MLYYRKIVKIMLKNAFEKKKKKPYEQLGLGLDLQYAD